VIHTYEKDYTARAIIVATGGSHNKLGVTGEDEYSGRGVSYCAVCDGNFFRGQDVVVVGGGDAAMDESYYLSGIVNSVTIIHRRDELRATGVLQERAFASPKYKWLWSHVVEEFVGNDVLEAAKVKDLKSGKVYEYPTAAAFIYVGFHPNSDYLKGLVDLDPLGHIHTDMHMRTKLPMVYACGDIRSESTRQLGAAVGDGITAALAAFHDLNAG
jgi:thioredoxin reductase (NADPH)